MILDTNLYSLDLFSEDEIEHEEDSLVENSSNENSLDRLKPASQRRIDASWKFIVLGE